MVETVDLSHPRGIVEAIRAAISAADHLTEHDEAACSMALSFALQIQEAMESGAVERRDKVMYGPWGSLSKILADLGLTPQGRKNLGLDETEDDFEDF